MTLCGCGCGEPRSIHMYKCGDRMIPKIGEVCTALLRHNVEVLSINDDNTANVALVPETPSPDNRVIIFNSVPFEYMAPDTDDH